MATSNMQAAFEAYLKEHGECDAETFEKIRSIFEAKESDDDESEGEGESEGGDDEGGLDLDEDTQKVYDQFKELSKDQQKAFCQAQRTEKLYQEFAELSEDDKGYIRESIGPDADNYDSETFLDVMEACIKAVKEVNEANYVTESADDDAEGTDSLDNFDFLK